MEQVARIKRAEETHMNMLQDEIDMALQPLKMMLDSTIDSRGGCVTDEVSTNAEICAFLLESGRKLIAEKISAVEAEIGVIQLNRQRGGGSVYEGGKLVSVTLEKREAVTA